LQAFNEGLVLSTKGGVDPALMLDILNNSAARSGLIAAKAPAVFKRDFSTNFSVKWLSKDIRLAIDLASELGVPIPLTSLAQQLYQSAMAKGYGEEDICGSIRVLEELAGCEVKTPLIREARHGFSRALLTKHYPAACLAVPSRKDMPGSTKPFHPPRVGNAGNNSKESRMTFANATKLRQENRGGPPGDSWRFLLGQTCIENLVLPRALAGHSFERSACLGPGK
jgi:hypothetical protein